MTATLQNGSRMAGVFLRTVRLLFGTATRETSLLCALLVVQGLVPVVQIWLTKRIVDALVATNSADEIIWLVAVWSGLFLLSELSLPVVKLLQGNLNEKLTQRVQTLILVKANGFESLLPFEDEGIYNDLELLRNEVRDVPLYFILHLVVSVQNLISLVGVLVLLATLSWWLPLLALVSNIPNLIVTTRMQKLSWSALSDQSPQARRLHYFSDLLLSDHAAAEVRLFGLGDYFLERYHDAFTAIHQGMSRMRRRQTVQALPVSVLSVIGNVLAFAWVIWQASRQNLGVGDIFLFVQAVSQSYRYFANTIQFSSLVYSYLLFFDKLFAFLALEPFLRQHGPLVKPTVKPPQLQFEGVSFAYPDRRQALDNLSFTIRAGEHVALVGENGAGKTTLVKLLARFYDPTAGQILVDGVPLRGLRLDAWRAQLAVVFQDFGRYHVTAGENIKLGQLDASASDLARAAELGGFAEIASKLPSGLDTLLGKPFGGTQLSGGQWQKLALARAFVRDAQLLILDEPSAALDPRSEHEVFERFAQLSEGRTTLLITHRLASVKMVDRILFLKSGQLLEEGSHDELMASGGEYAQLYTLQAQKYQTDAPTNAQTK